MPRSLDYPYELLVYALEKGHIPWLNVCIDQSDLPEEQKTNHRLAVAKMVGDLVQSVKRQTGVLPRTHYKRYRQAEES